MQLLNITYKKDYYCMKSHMIVCHWFGVSELYLKNRATLWNSMTSTSIVFTELANTMKHEGGFLYNLVFTEWRYCVSQNEVWGRGCYITLFSPSDVTAFHRICLYILSQYGNATYSNIRTFVAGCARKRNRFTVSKLPKLSKCRAYQ